MQSRMLFSLSFFGLIFSSLGFSLWSIWSWVNSWGALFTGARLTSPLGCDCGVAISFWQHPLLYAVGLLSTVALVWLTTWVSLVLLRSWRKTRRALKAFIQLPSRFKQVSIFQTLSQHIFPWYWPRVLLPQLVVIQQDIPRAMSTGVLWPRVFISSAALDHIPESELKAILTHELMHVRSLDPLLLWCASALASVLPLVWRTRIIHRLHEFIECKTDQEAAGLVGFSALGRALLRVADWQPQPTLAASAHIQGVVETRLHVLAGWVPRPQVPWKSILSLGAGLSGLLFSASLALQQVDQTYAQEVNSPVCLEAESIVYVNNALVLICPALPMSVE